MPRAKPAASGSAKPRKKANGYKFPEKLPKGEVLVDTAKKQWVLGESIGQGGFGEIYCASEPGLRDKWPYVIKIEPHENGPLFMEKNFYIRVAKPDDVALWKEKEGMKLLGIPMYHGSGTYLHKGTEKYRFLVMDRYGKDLWSLFLKSKLFPPHTVYKIALQIIDSLRYIHSKGYVHGDIKGQNLLLGLAPGTENQVFLVDFGLVCKYSQKEFQRDPKQAHNGTIEYTSCDWHMGVPTRRGDLEILGYNLLQWLSGSLPWEKDLSKCEVVHKKKQELMDDVESYITLNFPNIPQVVVEYMVSVSKLKHDEEPDYKYIKDLFTKELKKIGSSATGPLEFDGKAAAPAGAQKRALSTKKSGTAAKKVAGDDVQGKRSTAKRGAAAKRSVDSSDEEEVEEMPVRVQGKTTGKPKPGRAAAKPPVELSDEEDSPPVPAKGRAPAKPAAVKPKPGRAAAKPPVELSDDEDSPPVPTKGRAPAKPAAGKPGRAAAKPPVELSDDEDSPPVPAKGRPPAKTAATRPTSSRRAATKTPAPTDLSDEDMLESEDSADESSYRSKTTRPAKKAASSGDSKPSKSTKRSAPKPNAGSPTKKTKTASKTKAPPPTKKLDYRDAPKCLLPQLREDED